MTLCKEHKAQPRMTVKREVPIQIRRMMLSYLLDDFDMDPDGTEPPYRPDSESARNSADAIGREIDGCSLCWQAIAWHAICLLAEPYSSAYDMSKDTTARAIGEIRERITELGGESIPDTPRLVVVPFPESQRD